MRTTLVTCIYNGLSGTKYGGRNRDKMYRDSLSSIAKSGIPIFCFVFPEHKEELQKYFTDKNLHNVRVIGHDILSEDFHADIMRIKDASPEKYYNGDILWRERCPEIMWGKTRLISRIIERNPELEIIHWIDAGLSNASILRHKYFPNAHLVDHYNSEGFFTEKFFANLSEYSKDGIFAALHTRPNNARMPEHYNKKPYSGVYCAMIGGIFGGNVKFMKKFCDAFEQYIRKMLAAAEIYPEEAAYTGIFNDNPDWFKPIYFDTFYHEDWGDAYCTSHVSFAQVLETFLGGGMNIITFIVDVCFNNVEAVITEDIADNLQAFAAAGIDVQFLCLPTQYQHIKKTLSETNASSTSVKVVANHIPPIDSEISKVLLKTRRQNHKYAFYCDLQTITDDDIIDILDSQFVGKLCEYVGDKLINFKADGMFFGGGVENLGGSEFTKKYNPRDKSKNNVKSLLNKIKTGK